jgi:hypothetical protein
MEHRAWSANYKNNPERCAGPRYQKTYLLIS